MPRRVHREQIGHRADARLNALPLRRAFGYPSSTESMAAKVKPYPLAALEAMTTRQLLGHLARLRKCEESLALSDLAGQPLPSEYDPISRIYFKDDPRWQQQFQEVKSILAKREHVIRPAERRQESLRRKKAQQPRKKPRKKPLHRKGKRR